MGQNKLQRFAELRTFSNALEYPAGMKGKWHEFFKNENPVTLELACGKGEYAVGLGALYAGRNFIGIDIKGNRMWVGAKAATARGLNNVAFLRSQIEKIDNYFDKGEVAEIWITFPDPQLRVSKAKKRLTHPRFLQLYKNIMGDNGVIHLKTDSPDLYNFTKLVINHFGFTLLQQIEDLYPEAAHTGELMIQTHYEKLDIARSNRVHYLKFVLDKEMQPQMVEKLKNMLSEQEING